MRQRTVFVISPIGTPGTEDHRRYQLALDFIVKRAFVEPDWNVVRADEEASPDSITTRVIERIIESELIVVDLTDHNPNVFYELAIAHAHRRPVIHLQTHGQRLPFDIIDQRAIFYDLTDPESVDQAKDRLRKSADWLDQNPDKVRSPLTTFEQLTAIRAGSGETGGAAVADALDRLAHQVAKLEEQVRELSPSLGTAQAMLFPGNPLRPEFERLSRELAALRIRKEDGEALDEEVTALERKRLGLLQRMPEAQRSVTEKIALGAVAGVLRS